MNIGARTYRYVVGWGSGSYFEKTVAEPERSALNFLVDKDPAKWGGRLSGVAIYSPELLRSLAPQDTLIVVFSSFFDEIVPEIESLGHTNYISGRAWVRANMEATIGGSVEGPQHGHFGSAALDLLLKGYRFSTVLDVGSGSGFHSRYFAENGKQVTAVDLGCSPYFQEHPASVRLLQCNYMDADIPDEYDVVWASHVLEHQPNPQQFLKKLIGNCKDNGVIAITVPPLKHEIVGGHVSLWNGGLLLYHLVLAGIDCREARILQYGYNISILVTKRAIAGLPALSFDKGDIEKLDAYFPDGLHEPFDGYIKRLNWP